MLLRNDLMRVRRPDPIRMPRPPRLMPIVLAILSGVLLGCAFPPVDWKWLVWIGLVPLQCALHKSETSRRAFLLGYIAGVVFFLITLYPLISAQAWTGWAVESSAVFAHRMSRQWMFMHGIWLTLALWCALMWGCWAMLLHRLTAAADARSWRALLIAPSAWVLLPEWIRAHATFGVTWAFLGNATADLVTIRQLAALGGMWLLSALVVVVNTGVAEAIRRSRSAGWWRAPLSVLVLILCASGGGAMAINKEQPAARSPVLLAAALQHYKPTYQLRDFGPSGLDRHYLPLAQQALQDHVRVLVLPESITLKAVTLDGRPSRTQPSERPIDRSLWDVEMQALLAERATVLVIGMDTVEGGDNHNTLVAWTAQGAAGWYHKRRLVPFAEYQPSGWGRWTIRGQSAYRPGRGSQLITTAGMVLGGFICQEVLFPELTRASVRDGATLLVSGGNDGVFGSPAVAQAHADAAQIRAVETGRYLIRAMKTGISAIIDPYGRELVRSRSSEPLVLVHEVGLRHALTPFVRFGNWVVSGSFLLIVALAVSAPRKPPFT